MMFAQTERRVRPGVSFFPLIASWPIMTGAQVPQRDQRVAPPSASAPKGSAELDVLVTTDEAQSQPIRRVSVAIQAGELDVPHIGVTDDQGRVTFRNLAAGNYLLTAVRSGYVRTFYGSSQPGRGPACRHRSTLASPASYRRRRVITGAVRNSAGRRRTVGAGDDGPDQRRERRAVNLEGVGIGDDRRPRRLPDLGPRRAIISPCQRRLAQDMRHDGR
jgi:hypothetical protein